MLKKQIDQKILEYNQVLESYNCSSILKSSVPNIEVNPTQYCETDRKKQVYSITMIEFLLCFALILAIGITELAMKLKLNERDKAALFNQQTILQRK